jgi:hypothetical protein
VVKALSLPNYVRFDVLTVVILKIFIFKDITPFSAVKVDVSVKHRLRIQGRRIIQARNQRDPDRNSSTVKMERICSSET